MMETKKMTTRLRFEFSSTIIIALITALLFETDILPTGLWADNVQACYWVDLTCIIITLIIVPFALKFPTLQYTRCMHDQNKSTAEQTFMHTSRTQIWLLATVGLSALLLYYLTLDTTPSLCAAIAGLSLLFCVPSEERTKAGIENFNTTKGKE